MDARYFIRTTYVTNILTPRAEVVQDRELSRPQK